MMDYPAILSIVIWLPFVIAIGLLITPVRHAYVRYIALVVTLVDAVLASLLFINLDKNMPLGGFQWVDRITWIDSSLVKSQYLVGLDGLSAPLVLLTAILGVCAVIASWHISVRVKEYFIWLLVLQTAILGVFTSLDLLLFFLFWELELIPMYMLISGWGSGRKEYSSMKFLIFTILGSAFIIVGIITTFITSDPHTLDMTMLILNSGGNLIQLGFYGATFVYFCFFIGFAIKLPVWPIHTWLPDAHTDAPTAASVILAGVMLKMGGYGLLRINVTMFPLQTVAYSYFIILLGVISVLYGAVMTLKQTDLKRLIAYSSVSHMGLVLVGIGSFTSAGLTGAGMQLFTHGTITGLLFLCVGLVYDKAHTRSIPELGGLFIRMPLVAIAFTIAGLASLGLPALSGFVSEILVFSGAFPGFPILTILAVLGIILAAGYILWMLERVLFGEVKPKVQHVSDATVLEAFPLILLVIMIVALGIFPGILIDVLDQAILPVVTKFGGV